MSDEQAVEALAQAFEKDSDSGTPIFEPEADPEVTISTQANKPEPMPEQSAPEGSPPAATQEPVAPAPQDSEPSFLERADLDSLLEGLEDPTARERIERAYKSFQSGFTQARQRESEIVKQYEQLGDMQSLQAAAQLRQAMQDPGNLVQLYGELGDYLSQTGLVSFDEESVQPEAPSVPELDSIEDPELQPLKKAFSDMRSELESMRNERMVEHAQREQQQLHDAVVGELQRQENIIRQSHPSYTDGDIDAVYELGSFYDGNLLKAAERYEQIVAGRVERYLAGKGAAVEATTAVVKNPVSPSNEEEQRTVTLDDAHRAAMEALRHIEAAG